ncbi:MAG: translation initiation factor IF-3 [Phycisphaerales bacterium]
MKRTRINDMIRISPLRVIGPDNEQIGVIDRDSALRMAEDAGLDLVEISPEARPPVCKIMDYGKYKYELSKKQTKSKASSKVSDLKEVRLGRSIKVDKHDIDLRIRKARAFLMDGHKVQFVQMYRGREVVHRGLGMEIMQRVLDNIGDIAKIEIPPRHVDRRTLMLVSPDKVKIAKVEAEIRREMKQRGLSDEQAEAEAKAARQAALDAVKDEDDAEDEGDESVDATTDGQPREERSGLEEELGFDFEPENQRRNFKR